MECELNSLQYLKQTTDPPHMILRSTLLVFIGQCAQIVQVLVS